MAAPGLGRLEMRAAILFLLLAACVSFCQDGEPVITRHLSLNGTVTCPGNLLDVSAIASDGRPAYDVELRLVLYLPYQGLRALQHTDANGHASFELTKNGTYRIYINTDEYDHERYVVFEYPDLCPPPPPKHLGVNASADCENNLTIVSVTSNGTPVGDAFVSAGNWSTLTSTDGLAVFPLSEGYVFIRALKDGYEKNNSYYELSCAPFRECMSDSDCDDLERCEDGNCTNVTGECGYPANHTWYYYQCCSDAECGYGYRCANNSCVDKAELNITPPIQNETNLTNISANVTNQSATNFTNASASNLTGQGANETASGTGPQKIPSEVYAIAAVALIIIAAIYLMKKRGAANQ